MSELPRAERSPRFIARQMAVGFGAVSVVALAMGVLLLTVVYDVSDLVESMRHDETSIRQGMEVSSAARDLSMHLERALADGDPVHLDELDAAHTLVLERLQSLENRVPQHEHDHLAQLAQSAQQLHDLVRTSLLPALGSRPSSDRPAAEPHPQELQEELRTLAARAVEHADLVALSATRQMASAHDHATSSARLGLVGGGLCALLVVGLAVGFTWRLRAVVLKPLHALTDAAIRYGNGDFAFRMGDVGKGELAAVGDAFSRMADELARREARLLRNERMAAIGQLAAGVAHELNNPIAIIRGYLKTMTPDEDRETLREELGILDEEAEHCQRIAEDLLTYARAEDLSIETWDMQSFLSDSARRYEMSAGGRHVRVEAEAKFVQADGARLRQVLVNLLNNAGQVTPAELPIVVRGTSLRGPDGDRRYRVEVIDSGAGVDEEDRVRVFEPFFSKRRGGSGLGLAVCQGIVRAHGGTIDVRNGPSGGAVFSFELPSVHLPVAASALVEPSATGGRPNANPSSGPHLA